MQSKQAPSSLEERTDPVQSETARIGSSMRSCKPSPQRLDGSEAIHVLVESRSKHMTAPSGNPGEPPTEANTDGGAAARCAEEVDLCLLNLLRTIMSMTLLACSLVREPLTYSSAENHAVGSFCPIMCILEG